jgi:outer membrane lipoprotein-sorting protein
MKKIFSLLLPIVALFSMQVLAQSVDEIIGKHIEARGGIEKLKALQTMTMQGTMVQGGVDIEMKYYYVQGKATKVEFTAAGQSGYNIVTDKEGWVFNPFAGQSAAEEMPAEQLKDAQAQLDMQGPLVDYKSKGNTVEYLGKESSQGLEFYKLKVTRASGKVSTYYLDKNYLTAKTISTANIQGAEQEVITEYSDYRKTPEGYVIAFKRVSRNTEIIFDKAEINPKIDDSVFKPSN